MLKEVTNKKGEVLGSYTEFETIKVGKNETSFTSKDGTKQAKVYDISQADIIALATSKLNINLRNYIAGLGREGKPSQSRLKTKILASLGLDLSKLTEGNVDDYIAKLQASLKK